MPVPMFPLIGGYGNGLMCYFSIPPHWQVVSFLTDLDDHLGATKLRFYIERV